mmetsp:Transcript_36146/g.114941  ORF Transcript_36146/g.114941 Transcript_36146/m.114941 type:complete len:232 (+) Transcript_36146:1044-1739(+)
MGGANQRALPGLGHRRAVRRQVLRPRRPGRTLAPSWWLLPCWHRCLVLGGPAGQGKDLRGWGLPRAVGAGARGLLTRGGTGPQLRGAPCGPRCLPAGGARQVPGRHAALADWHDAGGPRHRPRADQGQARQWLALAPVPQGPPTVLRRAFQDAGRPAVGVLRPHLSGPHGPLRGGVPAAWRLPHHDWERQPHQRRDQVLQKTRRILPRNDWRHGCAAHVLVHPVCRDLRHA